MSARTQTLVQLTEDLVRSLDRRADREGTSRSQVIRSILAVALETERTTDREAQLRAGYERAPQSDTRDEWGDLGEWAETGGRKASSALAREEGEESW